MGVTSSFCCTDRSGTRRQSRPLSTCYVDFHKPAEVTQQGGAQARLFRLLPVVAQQSGTGNGRRSLGSGGPEWLGKDVSSSFNEVDFYNEVLHMRRWLQQDPPLQPVPKLGQQVKEEEYETSQTPWGIIDFMVSYHGLARSCTCSWVADGRERHRVADLLVFRSPFEGLARPRMLHLELGPRSLALQARHENEVSTGILARQEGIFVDGFLSPPQSIPSEGPTLDLRGWSWGDNTQRRAKRLPLQRLHLAEALNSLLDLRAAIAEERFWPSEDSVVPGQAATSRGDIFLQKFLSAAEYSELALRAFVSELTKLIRAVEEVPVPQKWVQSSLALLVEAGVAPPRVGPIQPEIWVASRVKIQILGWSKSRLSLPEQTTADERQDHELPWKIYQHLLALLWRLCDAGQSMISLGIRAGSKFEEVFQQSDADGNGLLENDELTHFDTSSQSTISEYWFMAPFEATLYAEENCAGASKSTTASSEEARCKSCFDVCGKTFEDGSSMATQDSSKPGGFAPKVRSLRVTKGAAYVSSTFCFGSYNFGFNATSGSRVLDTEDGCVNFQESAHLMAVEPTVLETVTIYFLKEDLGPTFDHQLTTVEAADLYQAGIFRGADHNQDQLLTPAEYANAMLADMVTKAAHKAFMSSGAMEAAAVAAQGPDTDESQQNQAQLAREAFGASYQEAVEDPAIGTLSRPPSGISYGPNGEIVVTGGGSTAPVEYGDVGDESMVEGPFDPQNTGSVLMCTDGMQYHRGFCYDSCPYGYDDAQFNMCFKTTCPDGLKELASGLCKGSGIMGILQTQPKESVQRNQGTTPYACRLGDSFGPGAQEDNGNRDFTVIIASDPQLPWCSGDSKSDMDCAIKENWRVVQSMHNVESLTWVIGEEERVAKPIGVHITGDLTAYAHENQIQEYRRIWETRASEDPNKNIKMVVWPGLGNHDYSNNLNACFFLDEEVTWAGYGGVSSCAQRAIAYIRSAVGKCHGKDGTKTVVPNFGGYVDHYHKDSAAYAVKYGKIRFVHLHNYPTFRGQELTGVASTLGFLKDEVEQAEKTGDYLVLMIHDIGNKFGSNYNVDRVNYFMEITEGARILAMFAGHWHSSGGQVWSHKTFADTRYVDETGRPTRQMLNAWGEEVQVVRGYAPDKQKFLVTQWNLAKCFWRFGSVDSNATTDATKPQWHNSHKVRDQKNFTIPNCTVDEDYVPPGDFNIGSLSGAHSWRLWVAGVVCLMAWVNL